MLCHVETLRSVTLGPPWPVRLMLQVCSHHASVNAHSPTPRAPKPPLKNAMCAHS